MNEELLLELKEDNRRMAEEFAQESLADAIVRFYYTEEGIATTLLAYESVSDANKDGWMF